MKSRKAAVLAALVAAAVLPNAVFAQYEKDAVVAVMRNNVAQLAAARDASGKGDLIAAGVALADIARSMHSIKRFVPNKGDKAAWDKTLDAVVLAALKGAGRQRKGGRGRRPGRIAAFHGRRPRFLQVSASSEGAQGFRSPDPGKRVLRFSRRRQPLADPCKRAGRVRGRWRTQARDLLGGLKIGTQFNPRARSHQFPEMPESGLYLLFVLRPR